MQGIGQHFFLVNMAIECDDDNTGILFSPRVDGVWVRFIYSSPEDQELAPGRLMTYEKALQMWRHYLTLDYRKADREENNFFQFSS